MVYYVRILSKWPRAEVRDLASPNAFADVPRYL